MKTSIDSEDRMEQVEKEYPARASEVPFQQMPRGM